MTDDEAVVRILEFAEIAFARSMREIETTAIDRGRDPDEIDRVRAEQQAKWDKGLPLLAEQARQIINEGRKWQRSTP